MALHKYFPPLKYMTPLGYSKSAGGTLSIHASWKPNSNCIKEHGYWQVGIYRYCSHGRIVSNGGFRARMISYIDWQWRLKAKHFPKPSAAYSKSSSSGQSTQFKVKVRRLQSHPFGFQDKIEAALREDTSPYCSFLASLNCEEALDAATEFITLNERLCSRPHSITHGPDDKLHRLPWLHDPKGCLINQWLDMATISRRNSSQGCPGHILTPTHRYLAIFSATSPSSQVWMYRIRREKERGGGTQPQGGL